MNPLTIGATTVDSTETGVLAIRVRTIHDEEIRLSMWQRGDEPPILWMQVCDPDTPALTGPLEGDQNYALDPTAASELGMWLGAIGSSLQSKWDALGVTFERDAR